MPAGRYIALALVIDLAHLLYQNEFASLQTQQVFPTEALSRILAACIRDADQTRIDDAQYLSVLGYHGKGCTAQTLCQHLGEVMKGRNARHLRLWQTHLQLILEQGPLARRIVRALKGDFSHAALHTVYARLVKTLAEGRPFIPG